MEPKIKVTRIKNRWHARLTVNGQVRDEIACALQVDIGWICREMLRWQDKMGSDSAFASAARRRQVTGHQGKVWHFNQLMEERSVSTTYASLAS